MATLLTQDEYVEQEFFFRTFQERLNDGYSTQEILAGMSSELLNATKLPLAVSVLLTEVRLSGKMHPAMERMAHYFTPFQIFIIKEAEREEGRFDFRIALQILERDAKYRLLRESFSISLKRLVVIGSGLITVWKRFPKIQYLTRIGDIGLMLF